MKRIIRLTESDLARIVRRVINEGQESEENLEKKIESDDEENPDDNTLRFYVKLPKDKISKFVNKPHIRRKIERMQARARRKGFMK